MPIYELFAHEARGSMYVPTCIPVYPCAAIARVDWVRRASPSPNSISPCTILEKGGPIDVRLD
jgi:hypothetical protein